MINQKLLKPKVMKELRSGFSENNPRGVQVDGFIDTGSYQKFLTSIADADFKKSEVRDMHSYFKAKAKALKFFGSSEFLNFVAAVVGKKVRLENYSLRMLMRGNYTLLHDYLEKGKIEFFFDMTPEWDNNGGGSTVFVTDAGEKLVLPPMPNTLVIAESGKSYVKYINHLAGDNGRLMAFGSLSYK